MSNSISREEVAKVATLARLKLTEAEIEKFTGQLGQVLEYVNLLNEINTEDVEPMVHSIDFSNVFREDEPHESLSRTAALGNAPKTDGQYFLVPQILEGGE